MSMFLLLTLASASPAVPGEREAIHYELALPAGSVHSGALIGPRDPGPDLLDLRVRDTDGARYRLRVLAGPAEIAPSAVCVDVRARRDARWAPMTPGARSGNPPTCGGSRPGVGGKFVVGQALADRAWHVGIRWTPRPGEG
jgi:hypothetical protein